MSAFLTDLFQSIFTPGPTPTLLAAANATFACLQVTLFGLLVATSSIHFLILSFLSAGLWWAINWFAAELKAVEAEQKRKAEEERREEDSDTEAETVIDSGPGSKEVEILEQSGELKEREAGSLSGSRSEHSTEDEWERVSENEKDK